MAAIRQDSESDAPKPPKQGDNYYHLRRDAYETNRLNKQHSLFTQSFRFLLHPRIPINYNDAKLSLEIADIATGTGIWAIETAKILPPKCQIDGFDISDKQFPPAEDLPSNIRLREWDVLAPLPVEYWNRYDIVNVRALVVALGDDEWKIAVRNLVLILKPGGYLQWGDGDLSPNGCKVIQAKPMAANEHISKGLELLDCWAKYHDRDFSMCSKLGLIFQQEGLQDIRHELMSTDNDPSTRIGVTEELSQAFGDLIVRWAEMEEELKSEDEITVEQEGSLTVPTVEQAKLLKLKMQMESLLNQVYIRLDWHVVVGKKAE